jgi:hypothetical protein
VFSAYNNRRKIVTKNVEREFIRLMWSQKIYCGTTAIVDAHRLNALVTFRKVRCQSRTTRIVTQKTNRQLISSLFVQGIPDEIKTPTRGYLIACDMIVRPLVLSSNSFIPPQLFNCTFIFSQKKSGVHFKHFLFHIFNFSNCVNLKILFLLLNCVNLNFCFLF